MHIQIVTYPPRAVLKPYVLARVELRNARLHDAARSQPGREGACAAPHAEFAFKLRSGR